MKFSINDGILISVKWLNSPWIDEILHKIMEFPIKWNEISIEWWNSQWNERILKKWWNSQWNDGYVNIM